VRILKHLELRHKLFLLLVVVGAISLSGGIVTIWYTFQMQNLLTALLEKNLVAFQAAAAMETALVNQKGFVTYYYLDGNPEWLKQFDAYRLLFKKRLQEARLLAQGEPQKNAIQEIEREYDAYMRTKDQVITLYKRGDREKGARLHQAVRMEFEKILARCEDYRDFQITGIHRIQEKKSSEARKLRYITLVAVTFSGGLVIVLILILSRQLFGPLTTLLASAAGRVEAELSGNIVSALSNKVQGLIRNADHFQQELEKSREHLVHAEKLALVGKLAAGMAHSIRNPFTSVKMRLFSLYRSLNLTPSQKEDFEVVSQEIRHIDTIVQNFLEFSRPPKFSMQLISPSTIVDTTVQLLTHRLKSYNVNVRVVRKRELSKVIADPEQLKEVLVNIMINACEAMVDGGHIIIEEEESQAGKAGQVRLKITDTGPGILAADEEKIFQPFFTTKNDGTGLGLSIAKRIIDEHGGTLSIISPRNGGACFIITLPLPMEKPHEHDSDHRRR